MPLCRIGAEELHNRAVNLVLKAGLRQEHHRAEPVDGRRVGVDGDDVINSLCLTPGQVGRPRRSYPPAVHGSLYQKFAISSCFLNQHALS